MYQRILVPIDGSATSSCGLEEAIRLARLTGGSLRLLHVLDELVFVSGFEIGATYAQDVLPALKEGGEAILAAAKASAVSARVPVDTTLIECFGRRTSDVVLEQAVAANADLIVLGTHGRRGFGRMVLGSDAEQVVRGSPVPVLLVCSAEAASAAKARMAAAAGAASTKAGLSTKAVPATV